MNKIIVSGWLGRDAELKTIPSGKNLLEFSIGVTDGWGDNKTTIFWKCKMFGDRGVKLVQHFMKGTKLLVEGKPEIRKYTNKEGVEKTSPEIFVTDFEFMGGKKEDSRSDNPLAADGFTSESDDSDSSVPF